DWNGGAGEGIGAGSIEIHHVSPSRTARQSAQDIATYQLPQCGAGAWAGPGGVGAIAKSVKTIGTATLHGVCTAGRVQAIFRTNVRGGHAYAGTGACEQIRDACGRRSAGGVVAPDRASDLVARSRESSDSPLATRLREVAARSDHRVNLDVCPNVDRRGIAIPNKPQRACVDHAGAAQKRRPRVGKVEITAGGVVVTRCRSPCNAGTAVISAQ